MPGKGFPESTCVCNKIRQDDWWFSTQQRTSREEQAIKPETMLLLKTPSNFCQDKPDMLH